MTRGRAARAHENGAGDDAEVLAIGETMVVVHPARAEPLESATEFRLGVGGAESNVAAHLAATGIRSAWASAVGDDPLGRRVLAALARSGVDTSLVRVDGERSTGVYFKDPGAGVHYYRAGSAAAGLDASFAAGLPLGVVPWVHLSGITAFLSPGGAALLDAVFDARRAAGLPVSFDVNHRPALRSAAAAAGKLRELASRADLVFVGRDEAERLWGTPTARDIRDLLPGARLVVKDGDVGAHLFDRGREWFVPSREVEVVEPVGAGDAFAAGFLAATLAGAPPEGALDAGHEQAARILGSMSDAGDSVLEPARPVAG